MSTEHNTPPALPPEVREAIARAFRDDRRDYLADPQQADTLNMVCAALAPLWPRPQSAPPIEANPLHRYVSDPRNDGSYELHLGPEDTRKLWDEVDRLIAPRPAPVTADAETLADRVIDLWMSAETSAIGRAASASVLAPLVAELNETRGLLSSVSASQDNWIAKCAEEVARAEAAEREREHHKTREQIWMSRAVAAEAEVLREQEIAAKYADYLVAMTQERYRLRGDVADLRAQLTAIEQDGTKEHNAAVKLRGDVADLRAQLAAENQRRMEAEMQASRDAKRADANAAQLVDAREDTERFKTQRNDLLILFKAVTLVWGDKLSPETLASFRRIEDAILGTAAIDIARKEGK